MRRRSNLPDYLSSFESSRNGESGSGSGSRESNNAFEAAFEVAASDSLLPLSPPPPPQQQQQQRSSPPPRVHVIVTSNGSPYLNYQTRLLFASWQRVMAAEQSVDASSSSPAPSSPPAAITAAVAGFTRILHRTRDDALCREVPTLRVAPRTPACDEWCAFPVADRPEAVRSFFAAVRSSGVIPGMEPGDERSGAGSLFFFLAETDYLFLRPLRVPLNLFSSSPSSSSSPSPSSSSSPSSPRRRQLFDGAAFPFGYIQPRSGVVAPILERLFSPSLLRSSGGGGGGGDKKKKSNGGENVDDDGGASSSSSSSSLAARVPNTGPSPVLLPLHAWIRLLPAWVSFTEAIEQDLEAREVLGWIREMVRGSFQNS